MRSLADVIQLLSANAETGLTDAIVEQSRKHFANNVLTPLPREPLWKKFIEKFDEPIIKILLAAALLSMVVDIFKENTITGSFCFGALGAFIAAAYVLR